MTIAANTAPATAVKTLTPLTGYTPIMVTLDNTYDGRVSLWYVQLNSNEIRWRCRNNSSSQVTGITINVRVLYINSNSLKSS